MAGQGQHEGVCPVPGLQSNRFDICFLLVWSVFLPLAASDVMRGTLPWIRTRTQLEKASVGSSSGKAFRSSSSGVLEKALWWGFDQVDPARIIPVTERVIQMFLM